MAKALNDNNEPKQVKRPTLRKTGEVSGTNRVKKKTPMTVGVKAALIGVCGAIVAALIVVVGPYIIDVFKNNINDEGAGSKTEKVDQQSATNPDSDKYGSTITGNETMDQIKKQAGKYPTNFEKSEYFLVVGNKLYGVQRIEDALETFGLSIELNRKNTRAALKAAKLHHENGDTNAALDCLTQALTYNAQVAQLYNQRSEYFEDKAKTAKSDKEKKDYNDLAFMDKLMAASLEPEEYTIPLKAFIKAEKRSIENAFGTAIINKLVKDFDNFPPEQRLKTFEAICQAYGVSSGIKLDQNSKNRYIRKLTNQDWVENNMDSVYLLAHYHAMEFPNIKKTLIEAEEARVLGNLGESIIKSLTVVVNAPAEHTVRVGMYELALTYNRLSEFEQSNEIVMSLIEMGKKRRLNDELTAIIDKAPRMGDINDGQQKSPVN